MNWSIRRFAENQSFYRRDSLAVGIRMHSDSDYAAIALTLVSESQPVESEERWRSERPPLAGWTGRVGQHLASP
jgi:hypothetical protein